MDNNYNMMQANNNPDNKKKGFFAKLKEKKEKKERQKEAMKLNQMPDIATNKKNSSVMGPGIKSKIITPEEAQEKKYKRKRLIRNLLTIPELIIVIFLAMRLKESYVDYSSNVHQIISYSTGQYIYEIHREDYSIKVSKLLNESCESEGCERNLGNYDISFEDSQLLKIRSLFDIYFKFQNGNKEMTYDDLKTKFEKSCFFSLINNDQSLLNGKKYKKYKVVDFNEMSSYTKRGYQLLDQNGNINLYIAIGEKPSSGYTLSLHSIYINDGDLVVYVNETSPKETDEVVTMIAHPMLKINLKEKPNSVSIYDVNTGETFDNYDSNQQSKKIEVIKE